MFAARMDHEDVRGRRCTCRLYCAACRRIPGPRGDQPPGGLRRGGGLVMKRLLILGGTGEATSLAAQALARFPRQLAVTSSLAGRTEEPSPLAGDVRIGGFGGPEGLAAYLRDS